MHIAIFTSPSVQKGKFVSEAITTADLIIAADCGALSALSMRITPKVVVGDFDSLDAQTIKSLKKQHVRFIQTSPEKDETDTQLAINYAIEQGAAKISLIGGIEGDRVDHAAANISLTYHPKVSIYLVNGPSISWVVLGPQHVAISGKENDLLSLIPFSQVVTNIQTKGLFYPLLNEPLYFGVPRGISNIFAEKNVNVSFENGLLFFVHTNPEEIAASK